EDIPELVEHFCGAVCKRHGFPELSASRRALAACREAAWPGHVRPLVHAIEAGVIRAHGEGSKVLEAYYIFPEEEPRDEPQRTYYDSTRRQQKRLVREALERHDWNVAEAARELDLARSYVYNLYHEFGLERSSSI